MGNEPKISPDFTVEHHEERIQRLETEFQQVSSGLAKLTVSVEYLGKQLEGTSQNISEKVDTVLGQLSKNDDQLLKFDERIDDIETREEGRYRRWQTMKKMLMAISLTAIGAVITVLVESWR